MRSLEEIRALNAPKTPSKASPLYHPEAYGDVFVADLIQDIPVITNVPAGYRLIDQHLDSLHLSVRRWMYDHMLRNTSVSFARSPQAATFYALQRVPAVVEEAA